MLSKTKINNSIYSVTGGKTCINGTSYKIAKGKSYIDGSNYNINFYEYYWRKYEAIPFTNGYNGDNLAYYKTDSYTDSSDRTSKLQKIQYTTVYAKGSSPSGGCVAVTGMQGPFVAQDYPEGTTMSGTFCSSYTKGTRFYLYTTTYEAHYYEDIDEYSWRSTEKVNIVEYSRKSTDSAFVRGALIGIVGSNNQNEYTEGVDSSGKYIYFKK